MLINNRNRNMTDFGVLLVDEPPPDIMFSFSANRSQINELTNVDKPPVSLLRRVRSHNDLHSGESDLNNESLGLDSVSDDFEIIDRLECVSIFDRLPLEVNHGLDVTDYPDNNIANSTRDGAIFNNNDLISFDHQPHRYQPLLIYGLQPVPPIIKRMIWKSDTFREIQSIIATVSEHPCGKWILQILSYHGDKMFWKNVGRYRWIRATSGETCVEYSGATATAIDAISIDQKIALNIELSLSKLKDLQDPLTRTNIGTYDHPIEIEDAYQAIRMTLSVHTSLVINTMTEPCYRTSFIINKVSKAIDCDFNLGRIALWIVYQLALIYSDNTVKSRSDHNDVLSDHENLYLKATETNASILSSWEMRDFLNFLGVKKRIYVKILISLTYYLATDVIPSNQIPTPSTNDGTSCECGCDGDDYYGVDDISQRLYDINMFIDHCFTGIVDHKSFITVLKDQLISSIITITAINLSR